MDCRNFEYEKTDQGIRLTKYLGNEEEVRLPKTIDGELVTILGSHAFFENGMDVQKIIIPGNIRVIEPYAFEFCLGLRELQIDEGVEVLGRGFLSVSQQECLWIPSTVRVIEAPDELGVRLEIAPANPWYWTDDFALFHRNEDGSVSLEAAWPDAEESEYRIPEGVTAIRAHAFDGQEHLRKLYLPSTLRDAAEGVLVNLRNQFDEEGGIRMIKVSPDNPYFFMEDSGLYRRLETGGLELVRYFGQQRELIPSEAIHVIGSGAFASSDLARFTVTPQIERICEDAFFNCPLEEVRFQKEGVQLYFPTIHPYLLKGVLKGFGHNGKIYDFSDYDRVLDDTSMTPEKARMIFCRLKYPVDLPDETRAHYRALIRRSLEKVVRKQTQQMDLKGLKELTELGFVTRGNVDAVVEILNTGHWQEGLSVVMNYKNQKLGNEDFDFSL